MACMPNHKLDVTERGSLMSKHYEVKVTINAVVLVKVDDHESEDQAMEYASNEFRVPGDLSAEVIKELKTNSEIGESKRHCDLVLLS